MILGSWKEKPSNEFTKVWYDQESTPLLELYYGTLTI